MHQLIHHTRPDGAPYPVEQCRIYQAFREGEGTHVGELRALWICECLDRSRVPAAGAASSAITKLAGLP